MSLIYLAVSQSRTITATGYDYGVPPSAQWAMCLLSPVALALAMDKVLFCGLFENHLESIMIIVSLVILDIAVKVIFFRVCMVTTPI